MWNCYFTYFDVCMSNFPWYSLWDRCWKQVCVKRYLEQNVDNVEAEKIHSNWYL